MNKYTTIQVDMETHNKLKQYCKDNGYSISGFVRKLVLENISKDYLGKKPDPSKVLRVK